MSRVTGELRSRMIDREQWSHLDRARHDLLLKGSGEGYVELYFGKAFSSPPTFTYSAIFDQEESEVLTWFLVSPRGSLTRVVDQYGMGNDSQSHSGLMQDAGFESQAKYHVFDVDAASQIPTMSWVTNALEVTFESFPVEKMMEDMNPYPTNDWAPKYGLGTMNELGPHRWLQTEDTRDLWSVTVTDGHDLGVGEAGQASAVATIGSNGFTNWLIPFDAAYWWDSTIQDPEHQWRMIRSVREWVSDTVSASYGGGIYARAYPPPFLGGFKGFLYVKSDSDVEVQVNATFAVEATWDLEEPIRGKKIFSNASYYGDWGLNAANEYSYRELASIDFVQQSSGGWSRVDIVLPYDGWRAWPDAYECLTSKNEPWDTFWNLRFRVKGDPGTQVSLDNIYIDRELRNAEIPILTVGVDEWIRDEAGVYIGAKLWVKMGMPADPCNSGQVGG